MSVDQTALDIAVISYRKQAFERRFGCTVRDLMIVRALANLDQVRRIAWFERPDMIHEAIGRAFWSKTEESKFHRHRKVDLNVFGQARMRRKWTPRSFRLNEDALLQWETDSLRGCQKVVLDFHPTYQLPLSKPADTIYWYDMIDNFTKHHSYDAAEQELVRAKYEFVKRHANAVTGVTPECIDGFANAMVVPNRLLRQTWSNITLYARPQFDLGFLGFVTAKLDVAFLTRCARLGLKTLICGQVYDKRVASQLSQITGLKMHGAFSAKDAPALMQKFNVGLIPYLSDKSHDESPIKFFQYILSGRPVLQSRHFNKVEASFGHDVSYYPQLSDKELLNFIERASNPEVRAELAATARNSQSVFWETGIATILQDVMQMSVGFANTIQQQHRR